VRLALIANDNGRSMPLTNLGQKVNQQFDSYLQGLQQITTPGKNYLTVISELQEQGLLILNSARILGGKNLSMNPMFISRGSKNLAANGATPLGNFFIAKKGYYTLMLDFLILTTEAYYPLVFVSDPTHPGVSQGQTNGLTISNLYLVNNVLCERPDGFNSTNNTAVKSIPYRELVPHPVVIQGVRIPVILN